MKMSEWIPAPALQPYLQRFMVVEFPKSYHDIHLPGLGTVAAFSLQGECRIEGGRRVPDAALTGLYKTARSHDHLGGHAVLLAIFTPVGAASFLRPSLEEFVEATTDLADVLGQRGELSRLHESLIAASDHTQRFRLLEDFLITRIRLSESDPLVTAAVGWLERGLGEAKRIEELVRYIGLSQSALDRRFRRVVGVSPKRFASLVRLNHAVKLRTAGSDLATVSHAAGYFDQSHFIKDFRRVTGNSPEAFFRQGLAK